MGSTGRNDLRERLAHAWGQAVRGAGGVIVLIGDPGMGKSSTLSWLAEHIGAPARMITCHGRHVAPPMSTAMDIAEAAMPSALERIGSQVDPLLVADELRTGLEGLGGAALLIDDIHDADPSTLTAFNLALRRTVTNDVLVVVTGRRVPAVLSFAEGFAVEELQPLPADVAARLLTASTDVAIAPRVAARLLELAEGNPLALTHVTAALSSGQLSGTEPLPQDIPLVGGLRTVFTRQLPVPGTPARDLLDLAAVSADARWAVLAALRPDDAHLALADLENAGLAELREGRLVLRHPLLRSATVRAMSPQRWRQMNLQLAALDSLPHDVRLAHRAQGSLGPDEGLVDELCDAAEAMRVRGGSEAAARMIDRAVDLTDNTSRRFQLRLEAAELLVAAGAASAARRRLEALWNEPAARDLNVTATLTLATLEAVDGAPAAAIQRLTECLCVAKPSEIGVVHARMGIPLGMLGLVDRIIGHAEAAVAHCEPHTVEWDVARLILAHAAGSQDESRANDLVDDLIDGIDLLEAVRHDPMVGLHVGRALSLAERYDAAASALTDLCARLRGEGARAALAMAFGSLGETHVRACRFDEALVCLDEAVAQSMATGQRAFAPFWLSLRARTRALRGDDEACAADLDLGFTIADRQATFGARYFLLANAGFAALTAGRYDDAVGRLEECWAFEQATTKLAPQLARWHADLVEAYVAVGRHDEAGPLVEHLVAVADAGGSSRWTRATALRAQAMLGAGTDPALAAEMLGRAALIYDPDEDCFDRARALMHLSQVAADEGERTVARTEAHYAFRRLGAAPWAARLGTEEATTGISVLTEAENRILVAVAEGLSNRQIAKHLGISAKTVANHLYHIYRKLGVASRTEAVRCLHLEQRR